MEFIYRKLNGDPSKRVTKTAMMVAAHRAIKDGQGPFTLKKNEHDPGPERSRRAILDALSRQAQASHVGDTFRVRSMDKGNIVFTCRSAEPAAKFINTNGNHKMDVIWSAVKAEFENISFLGSYVCKHIAGTSTMSQHSYGNALDIGASSMARLVQIAHWLVAHAQEFDCENVIVGNDIWSRESGNWSHYSGEYHYHCHVDAWPSYSGSCGVRG